MKTTVSQACYKSKPIRSLKSLAKALGIAEDKLTELADSANRLSRKAKPIAKADGTIRQPFDALPPLKAIQNKIKTEIIS